LIGVFSGVIETATPSSANAQKAARAPGKSASTRRSPASQSGPSGRTLELRGSGVAAQPTKTAAITTEAAA
jgi:hypothetical protein